MNDPFANSQLELACRVGSLADIDEALEDGANIDCNGSSPLFIAIMENNRDVVALLVERGASVKDFELDGIDDQEAVVARLMLLAPQPEAEAPAEGTVDAKLLRAFDRMIRNKGFAEPFKKGRGDEFQAFLDGLKWVGAEECYANAKEFAELLDHARQTGGEAGVPMFLQENTMIIDSLSEKYASAEESPGDLAREFLKEQKKVA